MLLSLLLLVICGLIYPLLMTGIGQLLFPHQANGSMIEINGQTIGSKLIGQDFNADYFMKCRPSAINYNTYTQADKASGAYSGVRSGADNYAAGNPALIDRVQMDMAAFLVDNRAVGPAQIPTDLMTASGSGLDPHISPAAAAIQIQALAEASGLSPELLAGFVAQATDGKLLGIFGTETVNVLEVNSLIAVEMGLTVP
jgi:K+-transporting ATPase ATPase C chain